MKLFILIVLFGTTYLCRGQVHSTFASNYTNKVVVRSILQQQKFSAYGLDSVARPSGLRIMRLGRGFTIGGPILLVTGIIIFSSIDNYDDDLYKSLEQIGAGIVIIAGTGMTVAGIVLWSVGAKQYKGYLKKQGATTSLQWKGNRLSLTYRF